ncbi:MBL fold metallo-hydrolase [Streptomyces liangshanensis]|uniref:hypothetical protein n=1 Tax=Streptomyces liangshanensis TaxID=2717324 RepID=UPI0036DBC38B
MSDRPTGLSGRAGRFGGQRDRSHTDGSIAVHLPRHGVLFVGDTRASVNGVTLGVFHVDRERARESTDRL